MESSEGDEADKNGDGDTTRITTIISIGDSDSSLSLSITPPSLGDGKTNEKTLVHSEDSISEHLSSASTSIENDRSLNEIEIDNVPNIHSEGTELQENKNEDNIDSMKLNDRLNLDSAQVKSILEEILNNEQFLSESESLSKKSAEDSFDIFANLDLEDKSLTERLINQVGATISPDVEDRLESVSKQVEDLEELLDIKEQTIIALTSELNSLRDVSSIGTSTEYKQVHEDYHNKFVEYNSAIQQKDNLIMQLTESLQESIENREELKIQVEHFKNELENLHLQLESTTNIILENELKKKCSEFELKKNEEVIPVDIENTEFEIECLKLEKTLSENQMELLRNVKKTINGYVDDKLDANKKENDRELEKLKSIMEKQKEAYDKEIADLKEILESISIDGKNEESKFKHEMEVKHQKEMEDLRRYFEQKCTELEKNYSEEIFSQQSRKRSDSVSSSDDIPLDLPGLQNRPGPGGDAPSSLDNYRVDYTKRALQNLSKPDLIKLRDDFKNLLNIFSKIDLENSSVEDLAKLKDELSNFDVKNLFKIEMEAFRNEMKNKYNAELEILNQDYENKVDVLKVQQEDKLNDVREKYMEEIETLKDILNKTNKSLEYPSQEVGVSGDFEINEVVQSYERRLQEQVAMAKIDIIAALENQIQRLAETEGSEEEWPQELLTLKDRFTRKFENKIAEMEEDHLREIAKLKEDHMRNLNGALERARRRSLRDSDNLPISELKMIEERDNFKKQAGLLRKLLGELLKYFTQCEDEVNNTLVDELVRQASDKNFTDIERELNESTSSAQTESSSATTTQAVKRVHLAPNFKDLMSIVENSSEKDTEFSSDLRNELESCLEKLRTEANALLALSVNVSKKSGTEDLKTTDDDAEGRGSLNRKLIEEVELRIGIAEEAERQRNVIETMERERSVLEGQVIELIERLNVTQADLEKAQVKISELLESGQREIVSEGYGGAVFVGAHQEGSASEAFDQLQEKARTFLVGPKNHDPALLHLLEDLVRVGERILEENDGTKKDLQQQIDVAHKKYKQTCKFLEEQAVDREMERDESQKQITALQEQLKTLDRDRVNYFNINEEIEHLDGQLKEATSQLESRELKFREVEAEKNEAVERIFFLRGVIRELESQLKLKTETEAELRALISDLEVVITQQTKGARIEDRPEDVDGSETQIYKDHIRSLEAEVQKLRLGQELIGTEGALREVRNQLFDLETIIEKKTKDLEDQTSILSTTTCSSPSEDMSVRDVVRPKTPNSLGVNDCEIPLQQLARLKEKLVRHSRAEEAAMKRIRDLEMQIGTLQTVNEEHKTEREILKKEIADQLVLISSLQIRLDDQRIRAEHIEKQTNTSLENRIYDLMREINELQESLQAKNKTIANLRSLLEDMKQKMDDKETESSLASDDEMIITMQKEIEHLRNQNELLHKRLNAGVDIIPNLVENIISDKNSDIESLKQKLDFTEKQLEMYNSLNLDKSQVSALRNLKSSGTSLSEVLSIIELSSPEQARRMADSEQESEIGTFLIRKPKKNDTLLTSDDAREISSIENVEGNIRHYVSVTPIGRKNSTEVKSSEKRVHFDLPHKEDENEIKILIGQLEKLKTELIEKDAIIDDCNDKLKTLTQLESNIDFVQSKLEETQHTLQDVEKEMADKEEKEKDLRLELVQKNIYLEEHEKELTLLKDDCNRKDEMYMTLAKETKNLKKENEILESKMKEYEDIEEIITEKNNAIKELEKQVDFLQNGGERELERRLKENEEQCESLKMRLDIFSRENDNKNAYIENLQTQNEKLTKSLQIETEKHKKNMENVIKENEEKIEKMKEQVQKLENHKGELEDEIKDSQQKISEKEQELREIRKEREEDLNKIRTLEIEVVELKRLNVSDLEQEITKLKLENSSKIEEVNEKMKKHNEELTRYQELLAEKDRIIARFKNDSEQLQASLKVIQNKMQENGNVIDLNKKLRDEQMRNSDLIEEIQILKAQLMSYGLSEKDVMVASLDEITGKVKQELDYSAEMDSNIMSATEDMEDAESKLESRYVELKEKCKEYIKSNKELKEELETKKIEMDTVQLEDANLIEQLRIQLESTTENELELENLVETLKKHCEILEIEVSKLKNQLSNTNSKTESTEYKNLPSRGNQEVTNLKEEVATLKKELIELKEESKILKKLKKELEKDLKYNKDMLEVKKREVHGLEKKLSDGAKKEEVLNGKIMDVEERLQQKNKEVENSRMLIDDMERDRKDMKLQIDMLNVNLRKKEQELAHRPIGTPQNGNNTTADQLMSKIEELNLAVKNDKQTMDLIIRLTHDNTNLKSRIIELEKLGNNNVPYENQVQRSNFLFAKCLRVESYRKALIFQKRYLIHLLSTYSTNTGPTVILQRGQRKIRFSGIGKFRSSVHAIIAILRMKSIVRRWHSGARFAETVNSRYKYISGTYATAQTSTLLESQELNSGPGNFKVGQPVSRQLFSTTSRGSGNNVRVDSLGSNGGDLSGHIYGSSDFRYNESGNMRDNEPWTGDSPPCRDVSKSKSRIPSNLNLLKAPHLLSQYAERYGKIEENLEAMLNTKSTT